MGEYREIREISVGTITNEEFQTLCHQIVIAYKGIYGMMQAKDIEPDRILAIELLSPCSISFGQYKYEKSYCIVTLSCIGNNKIVIEQEADRELYSSSYVKDDYRMFFEAMNMAIKQSLKLENRELLSSIPSPLRYNPISCFNMKTGEVENIRFTPDFRLLTESEWPLYDVVYIDNVEEIINKEKVKIEFRNMSDECGDIAILESRLYKRIRKKSLYDASRNTEIYWAPIPDMSWNVKINTPMLVKDVNSKNEFWIYASTAGLIYGENVVNAPMRLDQEIYLKDSSEGDLMVVFDDGNVMVYFPLASDIQQGMIRMCVLKKGADVNEMMLEVKRIGNLSNVPIDDIELSNMKSNVQLLGESEYYDGNQFVELLSVTAQKQRTQIAAQKEMEKMEQMRLEEMEKMEQMQLEEWSKEHPILSKICIALGRLCGKIERLSE